MLSTQVLAKKGNAFCGSSIRCVRCSLGRPRQHIPGFPRLYVSICLPDSILWYLAQVPKELAQVQTGNRKGANALEGAHLPVNMGESHRVTVNHPITWECYQEHAMQNRTEALPRAWAPDSFPWSWTLTQPWLSLSLVLLSSLFTYASWNHLPGDLPEPESLVSQLALWENPTKMSDACGECGQVGDEGLSPLPPNSCWGTNSNMKVLGGGAFGKQFGLGEVIRWTPW